ncbi:MAG: hypothetical protein Q9193_004425 [Seirophora villosa]
MPPSHSPATLEPHPSSSPHNLPKTPVRACESCRARKVRCLPEDSKACQRCARSGRECVYTAPEKRRRRKRTDTRVAELEHMVHMLAARLEEEQRPGHESKRDPAQTQDLTDCHPSLSSPINSPGDQGRLPPKTAQPTTTSASLTSTHDPIGNPPRAFPSVSPPITRKSSHPWPTPHRNSHPTSPPFLPSPSLDYTKSAPLPTSLQLASWPDYLSPSRQQASWPEDIGSSYPSPSQSISLASTTASPSTEPWSSPELDLESLYPGSCLTAIDGCLDDVVQDAGMWWAEAEGGDLLGVQTQGPAGCGVPQGWDFPWGKV